MSFWGNKRHGGHHGGGQGHASSTGSGHHRGERQPPSPAASPAPSSLPSAADPVACPRCRAPSPRGARFCSQCAAALLGLGTVALLYLVTEELLTEAHEVPDTPLATAAFFIGFVVFFLLEGAVGG